MKTLEKTNVEEVFKELLDRDGETTSLDVKNELRAQGYWAKQSDVGFAIREIAEDKGIAWDYNGVYRTYYKDKVSVPQNLVKLTPPKSSSKTPPASPSDRIPVSIPAPNDWECSSLTGRIIYFKGSLSGPQARYAYSLEEDIPYVDVRSTRVK